MPQRPQPALGALQHGDAAVSKHLGLVQRHRAREVRQHAERLVGRLETVDRDLQIALVVRLALVGHVDAEHADPDLGIVGERRERTQEDRVAVDPGPPGVQGVLRLHAGIEQVGDARDRSASRSARTARRGRRPGRRTSPARRRCRARSRCRCHRAPAEDRRTAPSCRPSRRACASRARRRRRTAPRRRRAPPPARRSARSPSPATPPCDRPSSPAPGSRAPRPAPAARGTPPDREPFPAGARARGCSPARARTPCSRPGS